MIQYDESAIYLVRETLLTVLSIAAPILIAGVIVGLTISLLQSVTSIQDQTLTFVPKITVMVIVGSVLLPWIVMRLIEFTRQILLLF